MKMLQATTLLINSKSKVKDLPTNLLMGDFLQMDFKKKTILAQLMQWKHAHSKNKTNGL